MSGRRPVLEVQDWKGDLVRLYEAQWDHIRSKHPEMAEELEAIRLTISDPDVVVKSYGTRLVASRGETHSRFRRLYVRVPIEYSPGRNWVTTAYVDQLPPKGDLIYVRISPR